MVLIRSPPVGPGARVFTHRGRRFWSGLRERTPRRASRPPKPNRSRFASRAGGAVGHVQPARPVVHLGLDVVNAEIREFSEVAAAALQEQLNLPTFES